MNLRLTFGVLMGALIMQAAGPAQARDMTTVWDTKHRCFRLATAADCGNSYNVTTRTFISAAAQKAGTATADGKPRPTEAAPAPAPASAALPSQALRELGEKEMPADPAPKQEAAEKPSRPAQPPAKAAASGDEWDVASKAKPKAKSEPEAKPDAKKTAEAAEKPRGIRRSKASG